MKVFVEDDKYFIYPLLDALEKLGIKSAKPQNAAEDFERAAFRPVGLTPAEVDDVFSKVLLEDPWSV